MVEWREPSPTVMQPCRFHLGALYGPWMTISYKSNLCNLPDNNYFEFRSHVPKNRVPDNRSSKETCAHAQASVLESVAKGWKSTSVEWLCKSWLLYLHNICSSPGNKARLNTVFPSTTFCGNYNYQFAFFGNEF